MKKLVSSTVLALFFLIATLSCTNPPDRILLKAYTRNLDGDGENDLVVYFILLDANGEITTASGELDLTIAETWYNGVGEEENILHEDKGLIIIKKDFEKVKIGAPPSQSEATVCPAAKLKYSEFNINEPQYKNGCARAVFRSDGKVFKSKYTFYYK